MKSPRRLQQILTATFVACVCAFGTVTPGYAVPTTEEVTPVPEVTDQGTPEPVAPATVPEGEAPAPVPEIGGSPSEPTPRIIEEPGSAARVSDNAARDTGQNSTPGVTAVVEQGVDGTVAWTIDDAGVLTFGPGTFAAVADNRDRDWHLNYVIMIRFSQAAATFLPVDSSSLFTLPNVTQFEGIGQVVTAQVTDMNRMFYNASVLTELDLNDWNTAKVENMSNMFNSTFKLHTLKISNWDTAAVTNMSSIFSGAFALTELDLSAWNTAAVTNMSSMFAGTRGLHTLRISNWETAKVTNMGSMFSYASALTELDLSGWNTARVNYMAGMFDNTPSLHTLNISSWKTAAVTNMDSMFFGASALTELDLSGWDTTAATTIQHFIISTPSLSVLKLGPKTVLDFYSLENHAGHLWYETDSTDTATLTASKPGLTGLQLSLLSQATSWDGGIFMAAAPVTLNENRPLAVGGSNKEIPSGSLSIEPLTAPSDTFTVSGYTFTGWNTRPRGTGEDYDAGHRFMPPIMPVWYAQWSADAQTLTLEPNGGTGQIPTVDGITDGTATIPANTFTRPGYTFTGWNTKSDGTGTGYDADATYTFKATDNALYAQWSADAQTLTLEPNGSTSQPVTVNGVTDEIITIPENAFTRPGYTLTGWNTKSDGSGTSYDTGDSYVLTLNTHVLHAQWTADAPPTVTHEQGTTEPAHTRNPGTLPQTGSNNTHAALLTTLALLGAGLAFLSTRRRNS